MTSTPRRTSTQSVAAVAMFTSLIVFPQGQAASAASAAASAVQSANEGDPVAREIRSIFPTERGLGSPTGVAFDPASDELFTIGGSAGTDIGRLTLTEDPVGSVAIALDVTDPGIVSFDAKQGRLVFVDSDSGEFVGLSRDAVRGQGGAPSRAALASRRLGDVRGSAFDPDTGALYTLDATGRRIFRIDPAGAAGDLLDDLVAGAASFVPLSGGVPGADLRGLALDPVSGNFFVAREDGTALYEVESTGRLISTIDTSAIGFTSVRSIVLGASGDPTDDPAATSLYIVDAAPAASGLRGLINATTQAVALAAPATSPEADNRIVEVSLEPLVAFAAAPASLVQTIATSSFNPPSPDPAGITYIAARDTLLMSDSEVNEMPLFQGFNLWEFTNDGTVQETGSTTSFTNEPTGVTVNPVNGHLFVTSDDNREVYEINPGTDGLYGTGDDSFVGSFDTEIFGSSDPEGLAFDSLRGEIAVVDGLAREMFRVSPGPNGLFDGVDDTVSNFDLMALGVDDPEGIDYSATTDSFVIADRGPDIVVEVTPDGTLIRTVDISAAGPNPRAAGITIAPSSISPSETSWYIVDRGVDNDSDPSENDGLLYEFNPPDSAVNLPPSVSAGPDQSLLDTAVANLDGTVADDGKPNPPAATTTTWSQIGGPGTVVFGNAAAVDTSATFPGPGVYVLQLMADDSALTSTDQVTISVGIVDLGISVGSDDAEERGDGGISLTSGDIELVFDAGSNQTVGLRWAGVSIPQGAVITNAWVQFQVDEVNSEVTSLTIQGEAVDDPATFTTTAFGISSRPRTTAAVPWQPPAWTAVGDRGPDQQTPDVSAVIQEIVSRPGWVPGNAMALIVTGTGERTAESRNSSANAPAMLHIEFETEAIPNRPPVANPDTATTQEATPVTIDVVANDTDPDGNLVPTSATSPPCSQTGCTATSPFTWPSTNVSVEWGGSFTGPVQDSNGNLYVMLEESVALPDAQLWKSSDDGLTWALADQELGVLRDLEASWMVPIPGRTGELMVGNVRSSGSDARSQRFGMSDHATFADSFDAVGNVYIENDPLANDQSLSIAPWGTSNDLLAVYGGLNATTFDTIRYNTWDEATETWGSATDLMSKASTNFAGAFVVAGASGTAHVLYADTTNNTIEMKSITSDGTLSESSTTDGRQVNTNSTTVKSTILSPIVGAVYYDDGGTEVIQVVWLDNSDKLWMNEIRGGTVGSTPIQVSTRSVVSDSVAAATNESAGASIFLQGTTLHVFFGDLSNKDLYHAASVAGAAFSTEDVAIGGISLNSQLSTALIDVAGSPHAGLFYVSGDDAAPENNAILFDVYPLIAPPPTPTANGELTNNGDGTFGYTPNPGFSGGDSFTYEVCDDEQLCDTATVSITVTIANDPPLAGDDSFATPEDTSIVVDVVANDSDPDGNLDPATTNAACAACSTTSSGALVNLGDGSFDYTPDPNFNGPDTFVYEVCDTESACDTATAAIDVTPVNDAPVAIDDVAGTTVDATMTIDVVGNDTDLDGNLVPTSAVATTLPANGGLTNNGDGTFDYTPNPGFSGGDSFTYEVCDDEPLCDSATVSITVSAGVPVTFTAQIAVGSDDAEELENGNVSLTSGDLEFVADRGSNQTVGMRWVGVDIPQGTVITDASVQFQVDEANTVATSLTIEAQANDDPATFANTAFGISTRPRTAAAVPWAPAPWTTVGDRGPDQQTPDLTAVIQEIVNRPGWVAGNAIALIVTGTGERTAESFNSNANAPAELNIEYLAAPVPNRPPTAEDDVAGTTIDVAVTIDVAGNDTDPDGNLLPTSAVATTLPANGGLTNNGDGTFDYTPNPGFSGGDSFTYEVCDDEPLCDSATVTITVSAALPVTFETEISQGSDDAEERTNGSSSLTSGDIELVDDGNRSQTVGLRWTATNIPQGAVIAQAWVQFQVDEVDTGTASLTIEGQAADNPLTFDSTAFGISSRSRTAAAVPWSPAPWTTVGDRGLDQQTPDLTAVIQEIVNRPGWATGNALVLVVTGSGERTAESANSNANAPAMLHVEYFTPPT